MHHNISRFGSVPRNRFSCVCDGTLWNGVDLAVHGAYRILGCPSSLLFEPFEQSGSTQSCVRTAQRPLSAYCSRVLTTSHQREGVFATYEPHLDTDTVEKKTVLEEEVDV